MWRLRGRGSGETRRSEGGTENGEEVLYEGQRGEDS